MVLVPKPTLEPGVLGGGGWSVFVRVRFGDGGEATANVGCWGIGQERSPICTDTPVVYVTSASSGGYRDVPCAGENGEGCATALPAIRPDAQAAAAPLRVAAVDIPIDHVGHYELQLGHVTFPNGILTKVSGSLADDHPTAFVLADDVQISVRSRDPTRPPFENYYRHGWWPGTEEADVRLAFNVEEFEAGAVLQVRDIVVQ